MKKHKLILLIFAMFVIVGCNKKNEENKEPKEEDTKISNIIDYDGIEPLYKRIVGMNCNNYIVFDIDNKISSDEMDDNNKLNFIFRFLELNDLLNDTISYNAYKNAIKEVFGKELDLKFDTFNYKGYKYIYGTNITRTKSNTCNDSEYYTKMIQNVLNQENNTITITIAVAKIKDDNMYSLNDELIGKVTNTKEAGEMIEISDKFIYEYKLNDSKESYYLDNISKNNIKTLKWEAKTKEGEK